MLLTAGDEFTEMKSRFAAPVLTAGERLFPRGRGSFFYKCSVYEIPSVAYTK